MTTDVDEFIEFAIEAVRNRSVNANTDHMLTTIVNVGNIVKNVIDSKYPPDARNKLVELSAKLKLLDLTLKNEFPGSTLLQNIIVRVNTANQCMQALMNDPQYGSRGIYEKEVLDFPPFRFARDIHSCLMQDCTNPICSAMDDDELKSTETFEKWEKAIMNLLNQLLIHETFVNGLFWQSDMYGPKEVQKIIGCVQEQIDELREGYKVSYWPETLEKLIQRAREQLSDASNDIKSEFITYGLKKIMTNDEFYVIVYDDIARDDRYFHFGNHVSSLNTGGCNTVVCRSTMWNKASDDEQFNFQRQLVAVIKDFDNLAKDSQSLESISEQIRKRIKDCGFVGIVGKSANVAVNVASGYSDTSTGPGGVAVSPTMAYSLIVAYK